MKTILGTFLALGLLSSAASAQWCPPGSGYGKQTGAHGFHQTHQTVMPHAVEVAPAAEDLAVAPVDPPVGAAGEPVVPVEPALEEAPPK